MIPKKIFVFAFEKGDELAIRVFAVDHELSLEEAAWRSVTEDWELVEGETVEEAFAYVLSGRHWLEEHSPAEVLGWLTGGSETRVRVPNRALAAVAG